MPGSLHTQLVSKAQEEGVSLNQFLIYLVTAGLGHWDPRIVRRQMLRAALSRMMDGSQYEAERSQSND
jgi:hypothetical protein